MHHRSALLQHVLHMSVILGGGDRFTDSSDLTQRMTFTYEGFVHLLCAEAEVLSLVLPPHN